MALAKYGLECQAPWCDKLMNGQKTIEMRKWRLPAHLIGQRIWLIQPESSVPGVPSLGDEVLPGSNAAKVVGSVVFSSVKGYSSRESFHADADKHLVPADSPYAFKEGQGAYGWVVQQTQRLPQPLPVPHMKRIKRTFFNSANDSLF